MSDVSIMYAFSSVFTGLAYVPSLGWLRYVYGTGAAVSFLLATFHGGKPL